MVLEHELRSMNFLLKDKGIRFVFRRSLRTSVKDEFEWNRIELIVRKPAARSKAE